MKKKTLRSLVATFVLLIATLLLAGCDKDDKQIVIVRPIQAQAPIEEFFSEGTEYAAAYMAKMACELFQEETTDFQKATGIGESIVLPGKQILEKEKNGVYVYKIEFHIYRHIPGFGGWGDWTSVFEIKDQESIWELRWKNPEKGVLIDEELNQQVLSAALDFFAKREIGIAAIVEVDMVDGGWKTTTTCIQVGEEVGEE